MINVVTVSGEEIRIDNSKKAISLVKPGFKSGNTFCCPECPYVEFCGRGVIVGVSKDSDTGFILWVSIEKYKPRVVACCNEVYICKT